MTNDPKDAEIARLKTEIERLGRDLNRAKYGEPDFSWAIHNAAMVELRDRAEKAEAERDAALAQVAGAYEAVAEALQKAADDWRGDCCDHEAQKIEDEIPAIRALTPADALAALSRRDAQMRAEGRKEGMREAARVVETLTGAVEGWSPQELIAVILAAAEKEDEK